MNDTLDEQFLKKCPNCQSEKFVSRKKKIPWYKNLFGVLLSLTTGTINRYVQYEKICANCRSAIKI